MSQKLSVPFVPGRRASREALAAFSLTAALLLSSVEPVFSHSVAFTEGQKIRVAEHIVVVTVAEKDVHWNDQRTLIVTDYILRVEDRLKGDAPAALRIRVAGGTLGDETHSSCLSTPLERGDRYVLFLNDLHRPAFSPFTGASQGVFHEVRTADGKRWVAGGQRPDVPLKLEGRNIDFPTFVASLRDLIAVAVNPKKGDEEELQRILGGVENPDLPAQEYLPLGEELRRGSSRGETESRAPIAAPEVELPSPPAEALLTPTFAEEESDDAFAIAQDNRAPKAVWSEYVTQSRANAPIVFNPLPSSFSWSPSDQNQMAYWNRYANNLFRVRTATGTWSFGNGVFDLAGFPTHATMIQQFGQGWGPGTLGVTWSRVSGGRIVEADIALNPAFSWTLDAALARDAASRFHSFQHTMLHELGHSWGLEHPWETQNVWWDSVMNYAPKQYRAPILWTDDTTAAYRSYPGISIRDGAVSLWATEDQFFDSNPRYVPIQISPPSGPFATTTFRILNPIKVENTGMVPLRNLAIEIWASRRRYSFSGAFLVKTLRFNITVPTFTTQRLNLGTFRMPANAPLGTYWIGVVLRDAADRYQANNVAW